MDESGKLVFFSLLCLKLFQYEILVMMFVEGSVEEFLWPLSLKAVF